MTKVKFFSLFGLIILLFGNIFFFNALAKSEEKNLLNTYILYDAPSREDEYFPAVEALQEYLGHFSLQTQMLPLADLRVGQLENADLVIVVGLRETLLSAASLEEIARVEKIVWFERNIEQLAAALGWQDFLLEGASDSWNAILFNDQTESSISTNKNLIITKPGAEAQIFTQVQNIASTKPFSWGRDKVYYLGKLEFEGYTFNAALIDFFYRFLPKEYAQNYSYPQQVLVRVDSINPLLTEKQLGEMLAELREVGIPYALNVSPAAKQANGEIITLYEKPGLIDLLQRAQTEGASIVMHGYTGEDYEFAWSPDDLDASKQAEYVNKRLEAGITELVRCGLYPVAFNPPGHEMSKTGYQVLAEYFNLFTGQIQISENKNDLLLAPPYLIKSHLLSAMLVIPENINAFGDASVVTSTILQDSFELSHIPDSFLSFAYPVNYPAENLKQVIQSLQKQESTFFDLRSLPIQVQTPQIRLSNLEDGQVRANIEGELQEKWDSPSKFFTIARLSSYNIIILCVVLVSFIYIIYSLRKNSNKKYEA